MNGTCWRMAGRRFKTERNEEHQSTHAHTRTHTHAHTRTHTHAHTHAHTCAHLAVAKLDAFEIQHAEAEGVDETVEGEDLDHLVGHNQSGTALRGRGGNDTQCTRQLDCGSLDGGGESMFVSLAVLSAECTKDAMI